MKIDGQSDHRNLRSLTAMFAHLLVLAALQFRRDPEQGDPLPPDYVRECGLIYELVATYAKLENHGKLPSVSSTTDLRKFYTSKVKLQFKKENNADPTPLFRTHSYSYVFNRKLFGRELQKIGQGVVFMKFYSKTGEWVGVTLVGGISVSRETWAKVQDTKPSKPARG